MTIATVNSLANELWIPGIILWFIFLFTQRRIKIENAVTLGTVAAIFLIPATVLQMLVYFHARDWVSMVINGVFMVVVIWMLWDLWKKWKNKKKALSAIGAKTKALRDKLVKNMRDTAQPAPSRS